MRKFICIYVKRQEKVSDCVKEHNMTPIKLMNSLDMFDCGTLAAHCVHVSEADLDIMAE